MESILFSPIKIKNLEIKNRFVRSATFEGLASSEGLPSESLEKLYLKYAEGDIGLIIATSLIEHYKNFPVMGNFPYPLGFDEDKYIKAWQPVVSNVHKKGAKIAMQLMHPGRQELIQLRGSTPVAPSPVPKEQSAIIPVELSQNEVRFYIEKFARAGRRVKEAGFDAVQLHGAHGYLISNFLSPHANRRKDSYGGSVEKRAKFVTDMVSRIKELNGDDFPVMIKMNFNDFLPGGIEPDEALELAVIFEKSGIDSIEVSGGTSAERWSHVVVKNIKNEDDESYFKTYSRLLKERVKIPVILVGGHRTYSNMQKLVAEGSCDLLSLSRPLIRDPYLINNFKDGTVEKSNCISCNLCFKNIFTHPVKCWVNKD